MSCISFVGLPVLSLSLRTNRIFIENVDTVRHLYLKSFILPETKRKDREDFLGVILIYCLDLLRLKDTLVFLSRTLLAWIILKGFGGPSLLKVYCDYPWPGFGGPIVLAWSWKRIVALEILSRRVLVTVVLKRTWYRTYTPWTCETIVVSLSRNIPRRIIIFREELKKRSIHSNLTYRIELPIEHSLSLKCCTFDHYKRRDNSRKVEKHSIGCLIHSTK